MCMLTECKQINDVLFYSLFNKIQFVHSKCLRMEFPDFRRTDPQKTRPGFSHTIILRSHVIAQHVDHVTIGGKIYD